MAEAEPALRAKQPWQAAYERDFGWFGTVLAEHYAGNDTDVRTLLGRRDRAPTPASASTTSRRRRTRSCIPAATRLSTAPIWSVHTLRWSSSCEYLEANGFANYIASGGGRDFMRPISDEMYGIPRDRVIGSSTALDYMSDDRGGTIMRKPEADVLDDGPQKPIRIWSRVGRRPLLAAGNSNGDIPMLDFTHAH